MAYTAGTQWNALRQGEAVREYVSPRHFLECDQTTYRVKEHEEVVGSDAVGDDQDEQVCTIETSYSSLQPPVVSQSDRSDVPDSMIISSNLLVAERSPLYSLLTLDCML